MTNTTAQKEAAIIELNKIIDFNVDVKQFDLTTFLNNILDEKKENLYLLSNKHPAIKEWLSTSLLPNFFNLLPKLFESHFSAITNNDLQLDDVDEVIQYLNELETIFEVILAVITHIKEKNQDLYNLICEILIHCGETIEEFSDITCDDGFDYTTKLNKWISKHDPSGYVPEDDEESNEDESELYELYEANLAKQKEKLKTQQENYNQKIKQKVKQTAKKLNRILKPIKAISKSKISFDVQVAILEGFTLSYVNIPEHLSNLANSEIEPTFGHLIKKAISEAPFIEIYQEINNTTQPVNIMSEEFCPCDGILSIQII